MEKTRRQQGPPANLVDEGNQRNDGDMSACVELGARSEVARRRYLVRCRLRRYDAHLPVSSGDAVMSIREDVEPQNKKAQHTTRTHIDVL